MKASLGNRCLVDGLHEGGSLAAVPAVSLTERAVGTARAGEQEPSREALRL